MSTATDPIADIARVAFVTRRFQELQGLTPALFGAGLMFAALMADTLPPGHPSGLWQAWNFATILFAISAAHMHRLYRETFGAAVATPRQQFVGGLTVLIVMIGGLTDMLLRTGQPGPSFAAVALAGCSIWVVARDWRWRLHHLVPATAGIVAAIITATAPPLLQRWGADDPARSGPYLLSFTILGLGMVTAGLFDHRLLASSLGPRSPRPSGGRMAIARADSGGPRAAIAAVVCAASGAVASWAGPQFITVALPLALMAALLVSQMVLALFQIAKGIRGGPSAATPPVVKLHFGPDSLALLLVIALAVAIESAIGARAIALVAFAIGSASAWVAVRDWPYRAHYLIGVVTSASIVLASQQVDPPRLLAIVVCATSAALTLEGLFDHVVSTRYRRSERVCDPGAQNADAI